MKGLLIKDFKLMKKSEEFLLYHDIYSGSHVVC